MRGICAVTQGDDHALAPLAIITHMIVGFLLQIGKSTLTRSAACAALCCINTRGGQLNNNSMDRSRQNSSEKALH